jgi:predicted 3-demethylubiquinone-9 3-methyltransferase (glyoxalase superfamily)
MADQQKIAAALMFLGRAEEAIGFYVGLFKDSAIDMIEHYGPGYPGPEGQVVHAEFRLKGQLFMAMDSVVPQDYTFNPAVSLFVDCDDEGEIDRLFAALSEGGRVLMGLGVYPFAQKYAWVEDRFGVSWQLIVRPVAMAR